MSPKSAMVCRIRAGLSKEIPLIPTQECDELLAIDNIAIAQAVGCVHMCLKVCMCA